VASRETKAQAYYRHARVLSQDDSLERQAAFGELVATIELEDPRAAELLTALGNERSADPSDQVLLADRSLAYETRFQVPVDLQRGREASQLLHFVTDPVARASFRNIFGYALASTGHFGEANALMEEQFQEAERCRLDFVIPYALGIQALVASGQRFYDAAASLLDDADERAQSTGDVAALQAGTAIRMRMLISQASYQAALLRSDIDVSTATRSLRGELLAVQALALAGAGQVRRSTEMAEAALNTSIGVETAICSHCALAMGALNEGHQDSALTHARAALDCAVSTGMIESFVSAYRGSPNLIVCLLQDRERHNALELVLTRAGDGQLLVGSGASGPEHSVTSLSPREKEVLALLAQGLTNAAIGQALFISPVTVKVHVRHIYDKLGVRSRAAAALRATQLNRG
jgi:DNA-binding CsgD family transcriptional regulator